MDAKISSEFWDDELIEDMPPEQKLCALWLLTNHRRTLCGYVEISEKMFVYQTGLAVDVLNSTIKALAKGLPRGCQGVGKPLVKVGKGYLWRNFIRKQFGGGNSLVRNNMSKQICREVDALGGEDLRRAVGKEYPELRAILCADSSSKSEALTKPLPRAREEKSIEEHRREEQEEGVGETGSGSLQDGLLDPDAPEFDAQPSEPEISNFEKKGPAASSQKNGAAETAVALPEQVRRFGAIFGRKPGERWSNMEETMLSAAQPVSEATLRMIEWRYRQPEEEGDPRRQRLATLLQNLPGEIDAARAQIKRHSGVPSASGTKRHEPNGWAKILEKKYRRPEDTEWMAPASFYTLPDSVQAEILKELKQQ